MSAVHVVVPAGIDDPARPSGGNVYDRRVCNGFTDLGWEVREHHAGGRWPSVDRDALAALGDAVVAIPDDEVVLVDGLIASVSADILVPAARRVRLVVLVHLPLCVPGEDAVLAAARAVVTTSNWSRRQLLESYQLDAAAVHVVEPGVDCAEPATGSPGGGNLLCVGPVSEHKGQHTLLSALAALPDLTWHCRIAGSLERDPRYVDSIRRQVARDGLTDRVELCGALPGPELVRAYATSDLLVHASRGETYGMVITEALARALPVVATDVGGVSEALGETALGRPGLLVRVDDPSALADALRRWLTDDDERRRLRAAAAQRRQTLTSWDTTAKELADVVAAVAR